MKQLFKGYPGIFTVLVVFALLTIAWKLGLGSFGGFDNYSLKEQLEWGKDDGYELVGEDTTLRLKQGSRLTYRGERIAFINTFKIVGLTSECYTARQSSEFTGVKVARLNTSTLKFWTNKPNKVGLIHVRNQGGSMHDCEITLQKN